MSRGPSNFMHLNFTAWGYWHIARAITEPGWPTANTLARARDGVGRSGLPGHRILAPEMGADVRRVQRGVMALSDKLRAAVELKYCTQGKHDDAEFARSLGLTPRGFRKRVDMAKAQVERAQFGRD